MPPLIEAGDVTRARVAGDGILRDVRSETLARFGFEAVDLGAATVAQLRGPRVPPPRELPVSRRPPARKRMLLQSARTNCRLYPQIAESDSKNWLLKWLSRIEPTLTGRPVVLSLS